MYSGSHFQHLEHTRLKSSCLTTTSIRSFHFENVPRQSGAEKTQVYAWWNLQMYSSYPARRQCGGSLECGDTRGRGIRALRPKLKGCLRYTSRLVRCFSGNQRRCYATIRLRRRLCVISSEIIRSTVIGSNLKVVRISSVPAHSHNHRMVGGATRLCIQPRLPSYLQQPEAATPCPVIFAFGLHVDTSGLNQISHYPSYDQILALPTVYWVSRRFEACLTGLNITSGESKSEIREKWPSPAYLLQAWPMVVDLV